MRTYFILLATLLIMAIWMGREIVSAIRFERDGGDRSSVYAAAPGEDDTSPCFHKRYAPDVRECGGLLQYSTPVPPPKSDDVQKPRRDQQGERRSARVSPRGQLNKRGVYANRTAARGYIF
jgi:hypothetical protein